MRVRAILRRVTRGFAVLLAVVLVAALAGLPVYVFPSDQEPRAADVVFVLGPATEERVRLALDLRNQGLADNILISHIESFDIRTMDRGWPKPEPPAWATSPGSKDLARELCNANDGDVTCLTADPLTTQGEARLLAAAMAENGWTTAIVVTMTSHVTRSQVLVERCVADGVQVLGVNDNLDLGGWTWQYLYQTAAFVKVAVTPGC